MINAAASADNCQLRHAQRQRTFLDIYSLTAVVVDPSDSTATTSTTGMVTFAGPNLHSRQAASTVTCLPEFDWVRVHSIVAFSSLFMDAHR